jgi:uncharacterized protein (DUF305 family)
MAQLLSSPRALFSSGALSSSRARLIAGALAAVLLLAIGYGAGLLTRAGTPGDDSPEAGFARDMSTHHAQAVEMGMIAYQNATLPDVRTLGGDIAITQQGQIGVMSTWLKEWGLDVNTSRPPMSWMPNGQNELVNNLMPGMATREEVAKLKAAKGKEVDILFCQYMLRHHLGGIHMVDDVLAQNPRPEVRDLAETMKRNQTGEVSVLRTLLNQMGAQPL